MKFLSIVNFTAAFQGIFLCIMLFGRNRASPENRALALLVMVISVSLLGPVLGMTGYYREFPHLIRIGDPLVLLYGPFLYRYISLLTHKGNPVWWHYIPFWLYLGALIPFYLQTAEAKIAFGEQVFLNNTPSGLVIFILSLRTVHIFFYIVVSLNLTQKFQKTLLDNYSDLSRLNLDKANFVLKLFILVLMLAIIVFVSTYFWSLNFVVINNLLGLAFAILIYALAYTSWNRPVIVEELIVREVIENEISDTGKRTRNTYNLHTEINENLAIRLKNLLETQQIYLQSELSLSQLSQELGVPAYQVSEVINRQYQETFFDLINRYRIEEIKRRLNDDQYAHLSILGIAMDCGFNSKSSFNTAFKKFTGMTPSEYKKK
ncbi:helix-turn-helix domain-containing protein [Flectobacillus roseus]|uniref:helix-turn-helix domain-containing protein n=1 Tax=Flectobacillus roseus TaxID=502259 RepID=UPI0024B679B8|nr:helix-turn-helix domain-containing protein [Flectobacillus roseus]MDI9872077.1 helix-turn-helix domain-containing protein [Flectobacillus roseus]